MSRDLQEVENGLCEEPPDLGTETTPLLRTNLIKDATVRNPYKFRYLVWFVVVWGFFVHCYMSRTLAIASLKIISSNVLQDYLTNLKISVLTHQLFGLEGHHNAALPGTCPIDIVSGHENISETITETPVEYTRMDWDQDKASVSNVLSSIFTGLRRSLRQHDLVDWTPEQRGWILASQPAGAIFGILPLSRLGFAIGNSRIITVAFVVSLIYPFTTPYVVTNFSIKLICLYEFIAGALGQGFLAVMLPFFVRWSLPAELAALIAVTTFGQTASYTATTIVSSELVAAGVDWRWCFYIPGFIIVVPFGLWLIYASEIPKNNAFISSEELDDLNKNSVVSVARRDEVQRLRRMMSMEDSLMHQCICSPDRENQCPAFQFKRSPLWKSLLTNRNIWVLIIANFTFKWRTELYGLYPTFYSTILHMAPANVGIVMSFKVLVAVVYGIGFSVFARRYELHPPREWSVTTLRKFNYFVTITLLIVASLLMVQFDCSPLAMVFAVIIMPISNGFYSTSALRIPLDLSPEDSGLINSLALLLSPGDVLSTPVSSYIVSMGQTPLGDQRTWKFVWLVAIALDLLSGVIFISLANLKPTTFSKLTQKGRCETRAGSETR